MTENKKIRVRFAPSPTGYLHVGGLRTALYNYLFAKKTGGDFILRIEDTDRTRYVEGAVESLIKSLQWAGLDWSEGTYAVSDAKCQMPNAAESKNYPGVCEVGEVGPYVQSERLEIYQKYAKQLVAEGKAYYCFCEPQRLEEMRAQQQQEKRPPMYDRYCLTNLAQEEINQKLKEKCPATIRLKVPRDETILFADMVRGKVSFATNTIDDQVLLKSDGFPTYHLANVVDDHLMGITHVIRGEEWLPSTPKHILLYQAFGWDVPQFAHLPLLLNPDRTKLSKRQGDVAVEDYLKKGYLKEALINFVALLGWNPGAGSVQEIFSLQDLEKVFELEKVHKAGAVFDLKKLDWINAQYIKKLSLEELYAYALPFLQAKEFFKQASAEQKTADYVQKVLQIEQERMAKFSEVGEGNQFFFAEISYDADMLKWKEQSREDLKNALQKAQTVFANITEENWNLKAIEEKLLEAAGEKRGELLWPTRTALTGAAKSPSPFEVAWVLGKTETLRRIKQALAKVE